ncbi:universal stress protein [soil metagenome]
MKILVAVDGSSYTQKALAFLTEAPSMFIEGNELLLLHVSTGLPVNVTRHVSKEIVDGYYAEESAKVLEPAKAFLSGKGVTACNVELRHGYAPEAIVAAAKETGAGLIVMGTHGHGMFGRALMGSVATKVVAESTVPVLLVK